jgi:hypothetical protein
MAALMNATDKHLYCVGTEFLASNVPYSITVWINANWAAGGIFSFVGMYDGGVSTPTPTTGLQIGTTAANQVECWTYGGATIISGLAGSMTGYSNVWTMITYTYDGTSHRLYRNNVLLNTTTTSPVPGTFTQVYINGYPPTGTANETGVFSVDSYTYYNRTLSLDEIQTIYNGAGMRHGITYGQIARYEFDELAQGVTIATVIDMTGNNNTLQSTGAGLALTYTYANSYSTSNLRPVQ